MLHYFNNKIIIITKVHLDPQSSKLSWEAWLASMQRWVVTTQVKPTLSS